MKRLYKLSKPTIKIPLMLLFCHDNIEYIDVLPPKKKYCDALSVTKDSAQLLSGILSDNLQDRKISKADIDSLSDIQKEQLKKEISDFIINLMNLKELRIPSKSGEGEGNGHSYIQHTIAEKYVADYAGISIFEAQELDVYDFMLLLRDSKINSLQTSEYGRNYLEDCFIYEQTEPDRSGLRELAAIAGKNK